MASDRRQSGLWHRNADTGFFEQQPIPQAQIRPKGPYQYYEPPPRNEYQPPRRSFSDRTGPNEPLVPATNGMSRSESRRHRSDAINAAKETAQKATEPVKEMLGRNPHATSEHFAQTKHINELQMPETRDPQPALRIDPDYVPENLRNKAWSPDIISPKTQPLQAQHVRTQSIPQRQPSQSQKSQRQRQTSNGGSIDDTLRRGSVPDRSPLQNLESWSKGEKRARVEEAERRSRQRSLAGQGEGEILRSGTVRSDKGRVVSEGAAARPNQSERRTERREVSGPASPQAMSPAERFQTASDELRRHSIRREQPESLSRTASDARPVGTTSKLPLDQERPSASPGSAPGPRVPAQRDTRRSELPIDHDYPRLSSDSTPAQGDTRRSSDLGRTKSGKYRARDAGFAGAAAAYNAGPTMPTNNEAAERGKAAYERRKSSMQSPPSDSPISPVSRESDRGLLGFGRSGSKKISKRSPQSDKHGAKTSLQNDRMGQGARSERNAAEAYQEPDPVTLSDARNAPGQPVKYAIPPQTAAGQKAMQQVGFGGDQMASASPQAMNSAQQPVEHSTQPQTSIGQGTMHHGLSNFLHHGQHPHRKYEPSSKTLDEWRKAKTAHLTNEDLELSAAGATQTGEQDNVWWEKGKRSSSAGSKVPNLAQFDGPYEEKATVFQPRLFLKCGPLLRYTGIRKEKSTSRNGRSKDKEVWRGTIMIVTEDDQSDERTPVLRLFAQHSDLHQLPPTHLLDSGKELPPEHEDPVAGQVKLSRTGRPLYVRPIHEIPGGVDLSRTENNDGLYSATRTPVLGPQSTTAPDGRLSQHITFQDKSRIKKQDGERAGRYRDVKAIRLHQERGFTFWRFSIEVELGSKQYRVAYRINNGPAIGFWVPAKGETMNMMFHSCNGFSMSVNSDDFSGPDPLWRDVLNRHQSRPFHVMIGGGDQVYNDAVEEQTELFREWLHTKNPEYKYRPDFSYEMQDELEEYYLDRYSMWFSQGLFAMANSQIPMVNIWDDHDIIDGFGSYPKHFMSTGVFTGLGAVAFKYYMLFQHQSLPAETEKDEPSWLLGKSPGPYINEVSRNIFLSLGNRVAFLGLDCRTERMRDEILSQETYDLAFARCRKEIVEDQTKHLIVLLGVPIAYPRLNFLENMLTSRFMDPIKAIGRTGMLGGFVNKFDGGVEILDDLDDHWTAKHHKAERNWFLQELQELAAEKSVRITILGGDVHLGAVGQFYTNKKFGIPKDKDHRYMPNVVSSAIVNTPPPTMLADVLNRRNKVHHLDEATDEDMIPMFSHDVDGSKRNNMRLLPRRNYCIIREYVPGSTPPHSPRLEPATPASATFDGRDGDAAKDRRYPPGSMKRTMSLTRGPVNLVRRLSGSSKKRDMPVSLPPEHIQPYNAEDKPQRANSLSGPRPSMTNDAEFERPAFHRRPTDLSVKEAKRLAEGGADGHIDLEGGLDISLCMEVNQHDPSGITVPYRLLVPALFYDGSADVNPERYKAPRSSFMSRLRFNRKREQVDQDNDDDYWSGSEEDEVERNTAANAMGLTNTGRGALNATPRRVVTDTPATAGAYNKGWNLSPPLSSNPVRPGANNNPYPESGYRRASAPAQARAGASPPTQGEYDGYDSLTPSEEEFDDRRPQQPQQRERRASKAERFLGIGDAEEEQDVAGLNRSESKKKPGWKIWR